ncbi:hypothetical protein [Streptomyces sp. NPDC046805]|uniref:hypothetical protein n=1 Tax=Streptomyces sp. NPDC046805 TaxID=3155134 RepID=UPI00340611F6
MRWLGANSDALIALITAVVVGILGLTNSVSASVVNSAILVTLAALALSLLRNKWDFDAEPDSRAKLISAHQSLEEFPSYLRRIGMIEDLITDHRATLDGYRATLDEGAAIRILYGDDINRSLTEARSRANEWIFRGGTATFVRAVVLPECVERVLDDGGSLSVRLEILDPRDQVLCQRYADFFRYGVEDPNEDEESWTGEGTQRELYSTIFAACWYKQRHPLLKIEVALSSTMTLFRWDMTQNYLFITERGPRFPAMVIEEGCFFYKYWRNELVEQFEQSHRVSLTDAPRLSDEPTPSEARELFARLQLTLPDHFNDEKVDLIVRRAIHAQNPYV